MDDSDYDNKKSYMKFLYLYLGEGGQRLSGISTDTGLTMSQHSYFQVLHSTIDLAENTGQISFLLLLLTTMNFSTISTVLLHVQVFDQNQSQYISHTFISYIWQTAN
jgi:hypothetical protein